MRHLNNGFSILGQVKGYIKARFSFIKVFCETYLSTASGHQNLIEYANDYREMQPINNEEKHSINTGKNRGKRMLQKIPVKSADIVNPENNNEFQEKWLEKNQADNEKAVEIIYAKVARILLGEEFAPHYKLLVDKATSKVTTITRMFENFKTFHQLKIERANGVDVRAPIVVEELGSMGSLGAMFIDEWGLEFNTRIKEKSKEHYLKLVSDIENFYDMLVASLLIGRDDIHPGNWGVREKKGKKYAAIVDHGQAGTRFDLKNFMEQSEHYKEAMLNQKFIDACHGMVKKYEDNISAIKQAINEGIHNVHKVKNHFEAGIKIPSAKEVLKILNANKENLILLVNQIEAEMAVINNEPTKLAKALKNFGKEYFSLNPKISFIENKDEKEFYLISKQSESGSISMGNFHLLIRARTLKDHIAIFNGIMSMKENQLPLTEAEKKAEQSLLAVYNEVAQEKHKGCMAKFCNKSMEAITAGFFSALSYVGLAPANAVAR